MKLGLVCFLVTKDSIPQIKVRLSITRHPFGPGRTIDLESRDVDVILK